MGFLNQRAHYYFFTTSVLLVIISFYYINLKSAILDINIHDTYFVVHISHFLQLLAITYSFLGLIYLVFQKVKVKLIKSLTLLHTTISMLILPIYFVGSSLIEFFIPSSDFPLFDNPMNNQLFITLVILIGLTIQLFFGLNIIISLFKHFSKKRIDC